MTKIECSICNVEYESENVDQMIYHTDNIYIYNESVELIEKSGYSLYDKKTHITG